ncbi:MAG: hypothetical protein ACLR5H_11095 [Oscillospiraceae bacterium]
MELFQKHDNLGSLVLPRHRRVSADHRLCGRLYPADSIPVSGRQRCTHRRGFRRTAPGTKGKTLRIGDHECTVTVVPSDMDVYHPLHYIPPASENLKKTLYVFSPSCEDALSLAAFPHVSVDMFIDRLILAEPTEESTADVRSFLYQNYSAYAEIQSTENFLRLSAASSTRTHQAYLLFYIMSTLVLVMVRCC